MRSGLLKPLKRVFNGILINSRLTDKINLSSFSIERGVCGKVEIRIPQLLVWDAALQFSLVRDFILTKIHSQCTVTLNAHIFWN